MGVPAWDSVLSVARAVTYDGGLSTVGDFNGMLRFYPVSTIELLRGALLLDTRDALGRAPIPAHKTVFPLNAAAGHLLDVEINITWEGGDVPVDFGSVGVSVLGATAPAPAVAAVGAGGCAESANTKFNAVEHGPLVSVASTASGSAATWGPATLRPGASCNQVGFIDTDTDVRTNGTGDNRGSNHSSASSYWLVLDPAGAGGSASAWIDVGWCSKSVGYQGGASWKGPAPQWLGYQGVNKSWIYRASGLFKASSEWRGEPDQGVPYGAPFHAGQNISARRSPDHLEFFVDGKSQGLISIDAAAMPDDLVGCIALCGGGAVATGDAPFPPLPPPPPPPPTRGITVLLSSGSSGSYSMNGVPLAPGGSKRPRPHMLTLRVLVDSSVVEAFAQGGRATQARMAFETGEGTAVVWEPGASAGAGAPPPLISVKVWEMNSAWL